MKLKSILSPIVLFLFSFSFCQSQTIAESEIDQQVWDKFKEAYRTNDATLFNSIHSDKILRITPRGIKIGEEYRKSNIKSLEGDKKTSKAVDFVFEHRVHGEKVGYEVGYYKLVYYQDDQENREYYGRFHVLLKKESDVWKIALDWDSSDINGHKVTTEDFERLQKQ